MKPKSAYPLFNQPKLTLGHVQFYERQGYLAVPSVLTSRGLQVLRDECAAAWRAEKREFDGSNSWRQNSLLVNIHHRAPTLRNYYFHGPLVDLAEKLIGPNIKGATSQLTFKLRGNTMPFGWHQDNGYGQLDPPTAISALTALDDTDRENGCLWLIPGSHCRGQIDVEFSPKQSTSGNDIILEVDEREAVPMPMKAGDVLLFHCWMLHKSDGNHSHDRDRRLVFLRYADADAVEVYNDRLPRLGRLLRGSTRFAAVREYEADL